MRKKIVVLYYEHINREYEACLRLKKEIEKKNYIVYLFSIAFEYGDSLKLNDKYDVDMVIMPWIYDDENYKYAQPFLLKNKNLYIVNLHHEQAPSKISEKVLLPKGENAKNCVIHFTWADFFTNKLIENGVNKAFIFKTGNIRNSNSPKVCLSKSEMAEQFGLDVNKKWILFSENRGWVLIFRDKHKKSKLRLGYTENDLKELQEIFTISLEATLKEYNELSDEFFEKFEIIYRPHPGNVAPEDINKRIKVINKYPIQAWFNSIDVNVSFTSSTVFETDLKGIPSFRYSPIQYDEKYIPYGLEKYQKISKFEDITEELIDCYYKEYKNKKIYENHIGNADINTIQNTSEIIDKILTVGIEEYNPILINYSKKAVSRIIRRERITRILVPLNLLKYTKWPHRSYDLRNDIPYCNKIVKKIHEDVGI